MRFVDLSLSAVLFVFWICWSRHSFTTRTHTIVTHFPDKINLLQMGKIQLKLQEHEHAAWRWLMQLWHRQAPTWLPYSSDIPSVACELSDACSRFLQRKLEGHVRGHWQTLLAHQWGTSRPRRRVWGVRWPNCLCTNHHRLDAMRKRSLTQQLIYLSS